MFYQLCEYLFCQFCPYIWRTLDVSIWEFYGYLINSGGRTMFAESCQGMEHALQAAKMFNRKKSNCNENAIKQTTEFLDLHCTGSIWRNQVNFTSMVKQAAKEKLLIFNPHETTELEESLVNSMPPKGQEMIGKMMNRKPGDPKDPDLVKILQASKTASWNALCLKIIDSLKNDDESMRLADDEAIKDTNEYLQMKIRMGKQQRKGREKSSTTQAIENWNHAMPKL